MMNNSKAFVVVGHSNWGKSETLKHLTDGNRYKPETCVKIEKNIYQNIRKQ